jgi:radical SAM protein with 4Fe4S-binding SPASM domain
MKGKRTDVINLLSKLTFKKLVNLSLVLFSYYISKWTGKAKHRGNPVSISVEPTTSCNLRCPQCPSGLRAFTRPTGMLQGDLYRRLIDDQQNTLLYLILYFQGEPYLNKGFLDMVAYASARNIYTATSTNAHYLNEENARKTVESGLDRIIISIDGADQESYSRYRIGGSLEKVLSGTRNLVKWKKELKSKTPHIIWQFIVFSHNEDQLARMKEMAAEYGVDQLAVKTAQVYDYQNDEEWIPSNGKWSRYKRDGLGIKIKNKLLNHCWKMWYSCVVTWDGKVVPCCFDKDGEFRLGNLQERSFAAIWKSHSYHKFRSQILKGRSNIEICKNCTEGTKVWAT